MKRIIKAILRPFWRALLPIRRRVLGKTYALMVRANADALERARGQGQGQAQLLAGLPAAVHDGLVGTIRAESQAAYERMLPTFHGRLEDVIRVTHHSTRALSDDIDLVLSSVVRELARLQMQVEALQQAVQAATPGRAGLGLIDEAGEGHYVDTPRGEERMMVG